MSFDSWDSYSHFSKSVTDNYRYIYDEKINGFIKKVIETSESRRRKLTANRKLWRAQIGSNAVEFTDDEMEYDEKIFPLPEERMYPVKEYASEGRANPKGIPYLYLASKYKTAISECRPWIGITLTVAEFTIKKDLSIVDCSKPSTLPCIFDYEDGIEPGKEERERAVWAHIDSAFSKPISLNEFQPHYAPTQILAEALRMYGYDGIAYKSLLDNGVNIVLFDKNNVEIGHRHLFNINSVEYSVRQFA